MIRFLAARALLICYSVIALAGQGLHAWIDEHEHCHEAAGTHCCHSHAGHSHCHHHAGCDHSNAAKQVAVRSHVPGFHALPHTHDCEHCAVCQHQSLGQMFVPTPPAEIVLAVCEQLSEHAPATVVCPALFSPAQPRAPPMVG